MKSRIMYVEHKVDGIHGPGRIGRVSFSQTGRTIYYGGRTLQRFKGYKANHFDVQSGDEYWISGCKRDGGDRLYSGEVVIDDDVREEYWSTIRRAPHRKGEKLIKDNGKYG